MLRALRVKDLAVIEELELLLEPGLNVVTGETGAGKSILLQALDVALGGRPDVDLVRTGADEAVVEAVFDPISSEARQVLSAAGLQPPDGSNDLLLRRVIQKGGRTRAYVNGALGSLALLRDLGPHLVRAYGQDEHQALRRVESHRELLDAVGGVGRALSEMRLRYQRWVAARDALDKARAARQAESAAAEHKRAELQELVAAALQTGEEDQLAAERSRLVHAERLTTLATGAEAAVYSSEEAAVGTLGRALAALRDAERIDPGLGAVRALVESALAELEEAGSSLGRYVRDLSPDPGRLDALEERLAFLARLRRKYAATVEELNARRDALTSELTAAEQADQIGALESAAETARKAAAEWAGRLSVERRRAARDLTRDLRHELEALSLDGARFTVQFGEAGERQLGPEGWDEVEFFLSTNPGEEPRSLARVASGGELSRIMLALKTLAAADGEQATLLFDEVDAGIGGAVAEVVGRKLQRLGRARQVLCITHLPLIAAFAEHHIAVAKRVEDGRTYATARPLSSTERVMELARMLGGAKLTREVREHAEQLLRRSKGTGERAGVD
jgi:DNA repair protein RecN (Recombination protein N)